MRQISKLIKSDILNIIHRHPLIERIDIAQQTKLKRPTVNKFIAQLLKEKKVQIRSYKESSGGKPSALLQINPELYLGIGVEILPSEVQAVIVDLSGNTLVSSKKFSVRKTEGKHKTDKVADLLKGLITRLNKEEKKNIRAIGIGLQGLIDYQNQTYVLFSATGREDFPVIDFLEKRLKIRTYLEDITRTRAIAEKHFGIAKNKKDFIYVHTGEGIGLGIVYDNKLYYGSRGVCGEMGHMIPDSNFAKFNCSCGNYGCIESVSSSTSILRQVKDIVESRGNTLSNNYQDISSVIRYARQGDKLCYNILTQAIEYLGKGIANAISLFGINTIVIGGDLTSVGEELLSEPINRTIKSQVLNILSKDTEIRTSQLSKEEEVKGSAMLALDKYIDEYGL